MAQRHECVCQSDIGTELQTGQQALGRQFVLVRQHEAQTHVKVLTTAGIAPVIEIGDGLSSVRSEMPIQWGQRKCRFAWQSLVEFWFGALLGLVSCKNENYA